MHWIQEFPDNNTGAAIVWPMGELQLNILLSYVLIGTYVKMGLKGLN